MKNVRKNGKKRVIMHPEKMNSYGEELKSLLQLKESPVAVKLISNGLQDNIASEYPKLGRRIRHCQITDHVRHTGEMFTPRLKSNNVKAERRLWV